MSRRKPLAWALSKPVEAVAMIVLVAACVLFFAGTLTLDLAHWISGHEEQDR